MLALVVSSTFPQDAVEGQTIPLLNLAYIRDPAFQVYAPNNYTASIDWGEGAGAEPAALLPLGPGYYSVGGTHLYHQTGDVPVLVDVYNNANTSDEIVAVVKIHVISGSITGFPELSIKAAPNSLLNNVVLAGFNDTGGLGPVTKVSATIASSALTDAIKGNFTGLTGISILPNLFGQYSATIDWGDGSTPSAGTVVLAGSSLQVDGTHAYSRPGSYRISATIGDRGFTSIQLPAAGTVATTADLNNDGRSDLVFVDVVPNGTSFEKIVVTSLLNQPDGSFKLATGSPLTLNSPYRGIERSDVSIKAIDLNSDGLRDLVYTVNSPDAGSGGTGGIVSVGLNQGSGVFDSIHGSTVKVFSTGTIEDLTFAKIGTDSSPGILVATADSTDKIGALHVYRNSGNATFSEPNTPLNLSYAPRKVTTGDWDHNGRIDVALTGNYYASANADAVGVFESRVELPNGNFGSGSPLIKGLGYAPAVRGQSDLNGDGLPDLLIVGDDGLTVATLIDGSQGIFSLATGSPLDLTNVSNTLEDLIKNLSLPVVGRSIDVVFPLLKPLLDASGQDGQTATDSSILLNLLDLKAYSNFEYEAVDDYNGDGLTDFVGIEYSSLGLGNRNPGGSYFLKGTSNTAILHATVQVTPLAVNDFDADGRTDLVAYFPTNSDFGIRPSGGGPDVITHFGAPGAGNSLPVPGDFDGDRRADLAVYLTDRGAFVYRPSSGGPDRVFSFGTPGQGQSLPTPGDYFGTGQTDVAVYLAGPGAFAVLTPDGKGGVVVPFGSPGLGNTIPAPGDYDGDGKADLAVYLPASGTFGLRLTGGGPDRLIAFGNSGAGQSIPAPGDYDGDGKTDLAVYLPRLGKFAYRPSGGGADFIESFGVAGTRQTLPEPGDYAGIGRDLFAAYLPAFSSYLVQNPNLTLLAVPFGIPGPGNTLAVSRVVDLALSGFSSGNSIHALSIPNELVEGVSLAWPTVKSAKKKA